MNLPQPLAILAQATKDSPWSGRLWLVGGAVRDGLLTGDAPTDFDVVLESSAEDLAAFLWVSGQSEIPPVTYPRFGTALVRIAGANIEFVRARKESYDLESRKPNVEPATLLEDAQRRDFTVNALMRNLHTGELTDPLGVGLTDLEKRVLRTPLEPTATFSDDPLRMLRAVRFRWKLGFDPAPGLYEAIRQERLRLEIISAERIRDEFVKILSLPTADAALDDLLDLGLLHIFAPELEAMKGVYQGHYHHLDVWDHSLLVLKNVGTSDLILSLAALLHDVGKPQTRIVDAHGHTRFFGHESVGADIAGQIMDRLKFPHSDIDAVTLLVRHHMRLGSTPEFTKTAARRVLKALGDNVDRLVDLCDADSRGLKKGVQTLDIASIRQVIEQVRIETPPQALASPLSGDEIMAITNLGPGPEIGTLKHFLTEKVLEGELQPMDKAAARKLLESHGREES